MLLPKILIISPEPYYNYSTSRTLKTFFGSWDSSSIAQIYNSEKKPGTGFCYNYYQITDMMMLNNQKRQLIGKVYNNENYDFKDYSNEIIKNKKNKGYFSYVFSFVRIKRWHKIPVAHLVRNRIWKKQSWKNERFITWLDNFQPDVIIFDVIDDTYAIDIVEFVSQRFKIPIISFVCDDYFFNDIFSVSPFYYIYRYKYKKRVSSIIKASQNCIYCCDMIKDKYSNYFKVKGDVVYTASEVLPQFEEEVDKNITISYLGNLSLGRWKSILELGKALDKISPNLYIDVYSKIKDKKIIGAIKNARGLLYHGEVSYDKVVQIMANSDVLIHVEDFCEKNMKRVKYSLSTKIADSLASGSCLLAYGPRDIGSIDYLIKNNCAYVITDGDNIIEKLSILIQDKSLRQAFAQSGYKISQLNHTYTACNNKFKKMIIQTVSGD